MPLYEYQCESCGDVFELMQKFSDTPLAEHSKCGGKVHRLISAPALQFKGSGWYITDYAKGSSGSSSNGNSKKDDGGSKASSSSDGGDSKPAATSSSSSDKKSGS
jgi:putative FmdB family regulatory protein